MIQSCILKNTPFII